MNLKLIIISLAMTILSLGANAFEVKPSLICNGVLNEEMSFFDEIQLNNDVNQYGSLTYLQSQVFPVGSSFFRLKVQAEREIYNDSASKWSSPSREVYIGRLGAGDPFVDIRIIESSDPHGSNSSQVIFVSDGLGNRLYVYDSNCASQN